ncbi:type IV toxin-antitoxin system AbiEi family antitoxin domain-containing protein [Kineothrix sp. MB12-C1]|uniref:type IV toxin-antitoxin system AbiEi family antitoxin domain-containing protein n=1 Tax=Kineothrix sp. MB12-C1 TaxID=3070215 RepID=UPI0027D23C79|nr:type IV toxin-antitoxin system AbiEi family antitoxin domain-containing protein [Kineothrix sp. MB12-C1]WMC92332.1 type IV toxin-antitoxin system AbiEi family antitoxin domain-containing protein [Kineothrix sp. MB12-C1]
MNLEVQTIRQIAENSDGIITTKQVEEAGLSRTILKSLVEEGILDKESKGIYFLADYFVDEYKVIQIRSQKAIFSYGTALYLLGLSDRTPHFFDVSVPQGCNVSRIKKDNPTLHFHYVKKEWWNIGITSIRTPFGGIVNIYNKERCICDLIRNKNDVDIQLFTQALKDYFKQKCDIRLLSEYGKVFGINNKVRTYVEVLY